MATNLPLAMNMPVTMTSLELVDFINASRNEGEAEVRHSDFLVKVEKVLKGGERNFSSSYRSSQNKELPMYRFPKRESCLMAMSYSYELQAAVYDRWEQLEKERQAAIDQEKSRVYHRELARLQCPEMTAALEHDRSQRGKETQWHHYATEFDMINRIVLGVTAKKFRINHGLGEKTLIRDYMPAHQVESIRRLQQYNATMMELGFSYEERKAKLEQKHNQGLLK